MKKILIVEDEKALSHALELKLQHEGFEPTIVGAGDQALDKVDHGSFNLIVLDLVMPKMDGFQVLEKLKEKKVKTPVIVLSNLGQEEDRKRVIDMGAKEYMVKSDTPIAAVVEQVKKFVG